MRRAWIVSLWIVLLVWPVRFAAQTINPSQIRASGTNGYVLTTEAGVTTWYALPTVAFQSLTTTGTSGAATLSGGVLNIPIYAGGVTQIVAGTNVTISPSGGQGAVTVNATSTTGLSGMTASQVPIAATATTVTSSKPLAGSGDGITSGPTSSTTGDCVQFTGTAGQIADAGAACGTATGNTTVELNGGSAVTTLSVTGFMPQTCADSSGSGTAQSCSTATSFTPQTGNCVVYSTTTANSGTGLTVNVNSLGAKSVAVAGSSGWTTTLVASSSIPASKPMHLCYDGTNWDASGTGYAASGGGGSGISGLTTGYVPLAGSSTTLTSSAHIDDGVTTASTLTATEPIAAPSLLATGIGDGAAPVTVTTGGTASLGGTYKSGYTFNQDVDAGGGVVYTLPTAAAGLQYCIANSYNGSAPNTGTLELLTNASGQYIIYTDGSLSASQGYVISSGAARDSACVVGVDATHWLFYPSSGSWAKY